MNRRPRPTGERHMTTGTTYARAVDTHWLTCHAQRSDEPCFVGAYDWHCEDCNCEDCIDEAVDEYLDWE